MKRYLWSDIDEDELLGLGKKARAFASDFYFIHSHYLHETSISTLSTQYWSFVRHERAT